MLPDTELLGALQEAANARRELEQVRAALGAQLAEKELELGQVHAELAATVQTLNDTLEDLDEARNDLGDLTQSLNAAVGSARESRTVLRAARQEDDWDPGPMVMLYDDAVDRANRAEAVAVGLHEELEAARDAARRAEVELQRLWPVYLAAVNWRHGKTLGAPLAVAVDAYYDSLVARVDVAVAIDDDLED